MTDDLKLKRNKNIIDYLPIIIFISIVPLVTYLRVRQIPAYVAANHTGSQMIADLSSYYRMLVIEFCGLMTLGLILYKIIKKDFHFKFNIVTVPALIYLLLTIVSSIISSFSHVVIMGMPDNLENVFVISSYIILFLYAYTIMESIEEIKFILIPFLFSMTIITAIGFAQFLGFDIFDNELVRNLLNITPSAKNPFTINIIFSEYTSYSTIYNPNYLSHFLTLTIPVSIAMFKVYDQKWIKILALMVTYFSIVSLIGSKSSAGFFALMVSMLLMLIITIRFIKANIMETVFFVTAVVSLLLITNIFSDGRIMDNSKSILGATGQLDLSVDKPDIFVNDLNLYESGFSIDTEDKDFSILNTRDNIEAKDISGKELLLEKITREGMENFTGSIYRFKDESFSDYFIITNEDYSLMALEAGNKKIIFYMTDEGTRVMGVNNFLQDITDVSRNEFLYTHTNFLGARGYYWSVLLPQLKNTIFLGYGPDTTFVTLPQEDYIGKLNRVTTQHSFGGPHNMYLKFAHNSGLLALISLLVLFGYVLIRNIIYGFKLRDTKPERLLIYAMTCSVFGYLLAGIFYDSMIFVAPVFWIVLALASKIPDIFQYGIKEEKNFQKSQ